MFGKRAMKVTWEKEAKEQTTQIHREDKFERRAEVIRRSFEGLGAKMFLGVCIYILLDTHRQVAVERAKHNS